MASTSKSRTSYLIIVLIFLVSNSCSSLIASGLDWPADRALPLFPDIADEIEYANLGALSGDEQLLLTSLQGLVNRQKPRLYLDWPQMGDESDDVVNKAWLGQLEAEGVQSLDVTSSPFQLIDKYRSNIRGAIIYDNEVPDTINLASTMAGISDAVLATEDLARRFDIPVLEDLRGRFSDKYEVHEYAFENVWPNVTDRLITAIKPISTILYANRTWDTLLKANSSVTDASNNGTYIIDLSRFISPSGTVYVNISDAFPEDGYGPSVYHVSVKADGNQTIADFRPGSDAEDPFLFDDGGSHLADYPGGWRFADGTSSIIYKFDCPPGTTQLVIALSMWNQYKVSASASPPGYQKTNAIFRDYIVATAAPCVWLDSNRPQEAALLDNLLRRFRPNAAYLGWFPNGDEMSGVTQLARNGVYVAATDFYFNPTIFSGFRPEQDQYQQPPQTEASPRPLPGNSTKIYLSLVYLEGDNIQYNQRRMFTHWNNPARGTIPLGWTISPLLRDIGPGILSYYQQTSTEKDLLVAGPDGAGYTYPGVWPRDALSAYLGQSGEYMRQTQTNEVLFVYNRVNSTDTPLTPGMVAAFRDAVGEDRLRGIYFGAFVSTLEGIQVNVTDGFPVTNLVGVGDEESGAATLRNISDSWGGRGPLFVAGAVAAFDMTPANVSRMVERLGPEFEVVRPDLWFELLRKAESNSTQSTSWAPGRKPM